MENNRSFEFEQFKEVFELLGACVDDYLYVSDLRKDIFYLTPNALERFPLPGNQFDHYEEVMQTLIAPEDWRAVSLDVAEVTAGKKKLHDMVYRWKGIDGEDVWINCRGVAIFDEQGAPKYLIGCLNEVGKRQQADNVSGLLGETSLYAELEKAKDRKSGGFILRVGIDNFKEINENKGLEYGDMILRQTAVCIKEAIGDHMKLYRIVADEFVVIDNTAATFQQAKELYYSIVKNINRFIVANHYEVFFTISGGIVELGEISNQKPENLMKITEFALNEAKRVGKNQYYIFDMKDYDDFRHRKWLISVMRKSVNHDFRGFEPYYQPIVDIANNKTIGAETLLRFSTGESGMVSPKEFICLLEESGLIVPVGRWVLHQALKACKKVREYVPQFRVSVNISFIQVLKSDILADIVKALDMYDLPPQSLMVELTESGLFEENPRFQRFCKGIQEKGVLLALDDFGTGYSNFHYLYELSPNIIKIDRSFTYHAVNNENEYNLLRHMIEMTHGIDLKLCIEGIENEHELKKICTMKPDYIQGYYFGKPVQFDTFMKEFILEN